MPPPCLRSICRVLSALFRQHFIPVMISKDLASAADEKNRNKGIAGLNNWVKTKKESTKMANSLKSLWCRRGDLNSYGGSPTRP